MIKKLNADVLIALGLFITLGGFAAQLGEIPDTAKSYPAIILYLAFGLTAIYLLKSLLIHRNVNQSKEPSYSKETMILFLIYAGLILLYIILLPIVGYVVTTLAFSVLSLMVLRNKSKKLLILLPLILTACLYALFAFILSISLPAGFLI